MTLTATGAPETRSRAPEDLSHATRRDRLLDLESFAHQISERDKTSARRDMRSRGSEEMRVSLWLSEIISHSAL
jgi:hypothetical protein